MLQLAVDWAALNPGEDRDRHGLLGHAPVGAGRRGCADDRRVRGAGVRVGDRAQARARRPLPRRRPRAPPPPPAAVGAGDGRRGAWCGRPAGSPKAPSPCRWTPPPYVDRALAFVAHKCSFAEIDRQVEKARAEYDPEETERRRLVEAEQRHAHVHLGRVSADGLVPVEAVVDLADALALEKTLAAGAARFDPTLPLDVRRSMALGQLGTDSHRAGAGHLHPHPPRPEHGRGREHPLRGHARAGPGVVPDRPAPRSPSARCSTSPRSVRPTATRPHRCCANRSS